LKERGDILRALLQDDTLREALATIVSKLDELALICKNPDRDSMRILDSLRIFPEVYNALCEGCHVIQAARGLPSSLIRLGDELERIVSTLFSEDFAETFKMNVVERPSAVSFHTVFDDECRLSGIALLRTHDIPFRKIRYSGATPRNWETK